MGDMTLDEPTQKKKRRWLRWIIVLILFACVSAALLPAGPLAPSGNPEIGRIDITTPIFSSESVLESFQQAELSDKIKVLIVRIDSPGGLVASSQEIYRRIQQFRERKNIPVIASVENVCASGAYYVAAAADTIIVNPGSQVGSIGVIVDLLNVRQLMDKFGIDARTIKTGRLKDAGDPTKRLTAEELETERQYFKGIVDSVLDQFVTDVASSRDLDVEKVRKLAHGGVFTGLEAVSLGLVDETGNYLDAVNLAAKIAGVNPLKASASLFEPPDRRGLMERVLFGKSDAWHMQLQLLTRKYVLAFLP